MGMAGYMMVGVDARMELVNGNDNISILKMNARENRSNLIQ